MKISQPQHAPILNRAFEERFHAVVDATAALHDEMVTMAQPVNAIVLFWSCMWRTRTVVGGGYRAL